MPATAFKLTIPKPCHNSWQDMTPNEKGRHCAACNKTVTDFTQLSDTEITNYFIQHKDEGTCGRFYKKQLDRITVHIPTYVLQKRLPAWKRFLVVLLLCFGSTMFAVEVKAGNIFNTYTEKTVKKDKKIKKKKRRRSCRLNNWRYINVNEMETTSGTFTLQVVTKPDSTLEKLIFDTYNSDNTYAKKDKVPSPFKKPLPPIAAVLPTVLAAKRRKRR